MKKQILLVGANSSIAVEVLNRLRQEDDMRLLACSRTPIKNGVQQVQWLQWDVSEGVPPKI